MNLRIIGTALSVVFVAVLGSAFYMVRPPEPDPRPSPAREAAAGQSGGSAQAGRATSGASVRESVEKNREGRRRLSRNSERMLQDLETNAELRRRGSNHGATWAPSGGGWGR
jgi:hypothetical protein